LGSLDRGPIFREGQIGQFIEAGGLRPDGRSENRAE
jgi:hypothetical protein